MGIGSRSDGVLRSRDDRRENKKARHVEWKKEQVVLAHKKIKDAFPGVKVWISKFDQDGSAWVCPNPSDESAVYYRYDRGGNKHKTTYTREQMHALVERQKIRAERKGRKFINPF